jgi:hypothetical protein
MAKKKPIISPFGQWAYPGEVTIIPSSDITMKGVNYPVLGIDNLGNQQMMMPGGEYTFPGDYVTEIPQMGKGGLRQWFAEEWTDVKTGKACGRSGKDKDGRPYPACRPSKRVNETTPKTTSEMSSAEKAKFKREKTSGKRIDYNHKRREFGGESWLDQYQDGGTEQNPERMQGIDIKRKRKNVSDSPKYQYDSKGNLLYTPELNIYPFMSDNSSRDSFWVTPKIPIQNLNPTVEELRTVAAPYYPIDNKLVTDPKINLQPSNYQQSLEQEYVLPQMVGKSFGNLPIVKDDGYSPNRRWITSLRNGDKLPTGYRNNSALYAYGPNNYAYVLKTDPNNLVNYPTKNKIENDLSLNDKALYDYLAKINYTPDNIFGSTRELPDQIWNRAEQMRVEMRNNPEIMSWANLHNVDLGYKERYEDNSEDNDDFAPKIPESIYAARLAKAGLPTNRPDYDYGDFETYIAQDPSKFNLVDYFPVDSFLKDAQNNPNNEKDEWGKVKDDQALKKQMAKRMGIDPSAFDNGEYLIHYNKTPITEYTPGKKYGGWLDQFQTGSEVPSDIERMDPAVIKRKRSWFDKLKGYVHRGEKAIGLDPYNERPDDFMEQWARRINTATGGKDWYKQPNDASGAGGIGTAMMETVMAPFSAPQLASVYGATGKVQMPSEAMNIQNPVGSFLADAVLDPTNLVGAGIAKNLGKGSLQNMVRPRMRGVRPSIQNSVDNIATPNISQSASISPVAWQAQELPGLHLKSTMTDGPISKIVEPKTGLVNVEQALGIIGKESGGVDKVALIKQSLGENIPKKMDYNDFRKTVQDQLIPLEKQFSTERSDYGIDRLGYAPGKFVTKEVGGKKIHTYESDYLDNQTILFSNKDKFGRGSGAHGNPDETLGHAHYLIDKESPDVLTVTQIQSDAFQGRYRIPIGIDNEIKELKNKLKYYDSEEVKNRTETPGNISRINYEIKKLEEKQVSKLDDNVVQKSLLDKNHQERYLQELVDHAGKQDYLNKVRVPTSETAAKVQGYRPVTTAEEIIEKYNKLKGTPEWDEIMADTPDADKLRLQKVLEGKIKGDIYDLERTTILKKYSEQPKTIKKLFGEEPKLVTDSKGNTWYEFDIPKKFKEGKGEIKAFSTIGGIGVAGAAASQLQEQKYGGWLNKYQVGGENLPELNSKIDIANFYKNPLSEKYSIYQDPEDNTYKYYKKSKETIPSKQNYISYTDQNKLMEDTLSEFPIIPPVWSEVLSSIPQEEKVNTITKPKTLPNKQSISKKTSTPQNQFSFDPNYWNDVNLQNEVFNRQLKDNKWYGSFDERGDNVLNRTDVKRNYDSEVFLQNMATPNSVIIDIGSALGNNNPKLAGVSVYELTSNPKIKSKNIKVIATDIPSEVKGFEELKKRNSVYPIDYTAVPETFNTPIRDILKNKKIENVKDVYLRAANSIDLLMNVQETAEHFKHISSTLKDKNVTYLYNNTILYKPAGSTKFKKLGNLNNSAFDHRSATWKNNTNRNHYTLLPTNENGGEIGWLNKYK